MAEEEKLAMAESGWATVAEAAAFMGVSVGTTYKLIHSGDLMSAKFRHAIRIPRAALRKFVADTLQGGSPAPC